MLDRKISLVVPTLNEEGNILDCLDSIARQDYPHALIEIIVVDAFSSDATWALTEKWAEENDIVVRMLRNERVVAEFGKSIGIKAATGDFVCVLDCDEKLVQADLLSAYVKAFDVFPDIMGVEHHFLKIPGGSAFNNFLALIHINDPLARQIASFPKEIERKEWQGKLLRKLRISPAYPAMFFIKKEHVEPYRRLDTYEEGQVVLDLARNGKTLIVQIDGYGVYHKHVTSFAAYMRKRAKIALKHMTRISERRTWVSYTGKRIYGYAFLNLTLIHPALYAIGKAVKGKDGLWLLWLPAAFCTTLIYAVNWFVIAVTGKRAW
jgi:glycosyltransferase involved in cell wall biosynthesis